MLYLSVTLLLPFYLLSLISFFCPDWDCKSLSVKGKIMRSEGWEKKKKEHRFLHIIPFEPGRYPWKTYSRAHWLQWSNGTQVSAYPRGTSRVWEAGTRLRLKAASLDNPSMPSFLFFYATRCERMGNHAGYHCFLLCRKRDGLREIKRFLKITRVDGGWKASLNSTFQILILHSFSYTMPLLNYALFFYC